MEDCNEKKLFDIKRKIKKNQTNNIVPFPIKICVLYFGEDKNQVLEIESELDDKNIQFVNGLGNIEGSPNGRNKLLKQFDYLVIILSSKCIEDYTLMNVLVDNFDISKNRKNKKIIPIIIEQELYEPEKRAEIIKGWIDRSKKYEKDFFRGNYGDEITKTLEKMQQITEMLKIFLKFSIEKDIKSDEAPSSRLVKKIEEYGEVIYERSEIVVEKTYNNCQFVKAKGHSTVHATQNNGINKDELKEIIDLIEKDLDKLNQEQAEDLKDTLSMVIEEFSNENPRKGRLKKCLSLIAPMIAVSNGIPVLAQNLQKVYDYILPFIN